MFSPRQALIAASVAGWCGDWPCSWRCPVAEQDILAWAGSYVPTGSGDDLYHAFQQLTADGLWTTLRYPLFERKYYYCMHRARFIRELPDTLSDYIPPWPDSGPISRAWLTAFWNDLSAKFSRDWGDAWLLWGMCAGQGSQSGSSPWGPCLGPSCSWFIDGKSECNWGLQFQRDVTLVYPNMNFLHAVGQVERTDSDLQALCIAALRTMGCAEE
jgi:hypothetical protein